MWCSGLKNRETNNKKNHRKTPIISRLFALMIHENTTTKSNKKKNFFPWSFSDLKQYNNNSTIIETEKSTFPNRTERAYVRILCLLKPYQIAIIIKTREIFNIQLSFCGCFSFSSIVDFKCCLLLLLIHFHIHNDYSITIFMSFCS